MANALAVAARAEPKKLRVALIADAPLQPGWVGDAFGRIARAPFAEIVLIGLVTPSKARPVSLLWRVYAALDRLAFGSPPALADVRDCVKPECIALEPRKELLDELDLDVLFVVGELDERAYAGVARLGVWRFWFGEAGCAEPLGGFPETWRNSPVTASGIQVRLDAAARPRIICESWTRTNPYSLARTRERMLPKTGEFAYRALREAYLGGERPLDAAAGAAAPGRTSMNVARGVCAIGRRVAELGIDRALNVEQWALAFRFGAQDEPHLAPLPSDLNGFTRLAPPKGHDWADPFPIEKNGRYFVFFEDLPLAEGKAHISMVELKRDGSHSPPVRVLERPYHLSYPFMLEDEGQLWMVPETSDYGTVEVYRCIDFPLEWRREQILLDDLRGVDATFHKEGGRWWMFVNQAAGDSNMVDDELHIYYASRFLGPWGAHQRNPVKSDARCTRPGGGLYRHGGHLYRPSQICVPRYGAGLCLNRVTRLSPQEYAEVEVQRILPDAGKGLIGLHTINRAGALTMVDTLMRRSRFSARRNR